MRLPGCRRCAAEDLSVRELARAAVEATGLGAGIYDCTVIEPEHLDRLAVADLDPRRRPAAGWLMGVRFTGGDTAAMAAGHLAGGHEKADMTQELVRYMLLASASATMAGVVFEGLRRRAAGMRLDRQLRDQRLRAAHLNRIQRVAGNAGLPIGIVRGHRDAPHLVGR